MSHRTAALTTSKKAIAIIFNGNNYYEMYIKLSLAMDVSCEVETGDCGIVIAESIAFTNYAPQTSLPLPLLSIAVASYCKTRTSNQ